MKLKGADEEQKSQIAKLITDSDVIKDQIRDQFRIELKE